MNAAPLWWVAFCVFAVTVIGGWMAARWLLLPLLRRLRRSTGSTEVN